MRSSIPDFARVSRPLRKLLESTSKGTSRKTKALQKIKLHLTADNIADFNKLNSIVANIVQLACPYDDADLFLFTDASLDGWAAALFQIKLYKPEVSIITQDLEPLYFLSGNFEGAKHRWSIPEKEAFAIVESVERLDYMLIRIKPFYILTDHRNHKFIFDSNTHLKQATRHKISRWALSLSSFNYNILFIEGNNNLWADLLSCWGQKQCSSLSVNMVTLHPYSKDTTFAIPSLNEILTSQQRTKIDIATRLDLKEGTHHDTQCLLQHGKIWIPEDDMKLFN